MQTDEINGFLIDQFNQHSLKEGATQGICPLCSSDSQPKNSKKQCASYDWERGLGTCHNCDNTFQLHTYQRKGASERVYVRPEPRKSVTKKLNTQTEKVVTWFKQRGISHTTVLDLKVTGGKEFMPQTGKEEYAIQFNYYMGDQLINIKYRDGRKNFKLYKGAEKVF